MISSTNPTDRSARPEMLSVSQPAKRLATPPTDQISIEGASFLRTELQRVPEIRTEAVARARELLKDPSYPSMDTLRNVAEQILRSPDLSEDPI